MFDLSENKKVHYSIGSGCGTAEHRLNAFDRALMASGCGNYNLVRVSSILPASAEYIETITLPEGSLLPAAFAFAEAGPGQYDKAVISAAVAVGIPEDPDLTGVIMEYSGVCSEQEALSCAIAMARTAMEDRGIEKYFIKSSSASCDAKSDLYSCVFAYIAVF